jgi:hypothetical protein
MEESNFGHAVSDSFFYYITLAGVSEASHIPVNKIRNTSIASH